MRIRRCKKRNEEENEGGGGGGARGTKKRRNAQEQKYTLISTRAPSCNSEKDTTPRKVIFNCR